MSSEVDDLQALVMADARKVYSETVIDHAMNPRNLGEMQDADGFARVAGSCGDTMEIWLKVMDGMIMFRDQHHLTATFAASLGPEIDRQLTALLNAWASPTASPSFP